VAVLLYCLLKRADKGTIAKPCRSWQIWLPGLALFRQTCANSAVGGRILRNWLMIHTLFLQVKNVANAAVLQFVAG
jgi:hypothetical protein